MSRLRLGFAMVGFILALVSVMLDDTRTAWGAIAFLTSSLIIRLVQRKRDKANPTAEK